MVWVRVMPPPTEADVPMMIPADWEAHMRLMIDLQVLAYQCDLTRVITFMNSRKLASVEVTH